LTNFANICYIFCEEIDMATMNVSLPDPMKQWVEAQARTGRYSNASDYVRDLIRRDQERAAGHAQMQRMISEGIESGVSRDFNMETLQEELDAAHG
jgi:antitoxin ParD1/3/4